MSPLDRWRTVIELEGLTKSEKSVLGSLAFHANSVSLEAWPSLSTMSTETGYERTAIRRAISQLVSKGLLSISRQSTGSGSNRYQLHLDKGVQKTPGAESPRCTILPEGVQKTAKGGAQYSPNKERTCNEQDTPSATSSIWDLWITIAGENNRSTLGRLINLHGELEVAKAVAVVAQKRPADPVAYIHGILKPKVRVTAI